MNIIAVIPSRMGSSRFPGKPMKEICGMPMIGHVWHRAKMSKILTEVYVATCDVEIKDYIEKIGGKAIMTKDTHERCTDRTAEAVRKIESKNSSKVDIVVMIQGDEPMLVPSSIDAALAPMIENKLIDVVNLMTELKTQAECEDPNEVKVVFDLNSDALYFSREPIPSNKKYKGKIKSYKQICIIPFRRDFLFKYEAMAPTPMEIVESVDMMRILEHGIKVRMVYHELDTYAVDTKEDLAKVESLIKTDSVLTEYLP